MLNLAQPMTMPTPTPVSITGYIYLANVDVANGRLNGAVPGTVIEQGAAVRPWWVVNHQLKTVIVARWPGRLWRVAVLRAAADQPRAAACYTRAESVQLLAELPVEHLFSEQAEQGLAVCQVIAQASALTLAQVAALGQCLAAQSGAAECAYSAAWNHWLAAVEPQSIHLGSCHAGTLAVFAGGTRSPIGVGFSVVHIAVCDRAEALLGDAAFIVDEEGERTLVPAWQAASTALLHAAMALGAPARLTTEAAQLLSTPWRQLSK